MELFLMGICLSILGFGVAAAAFGAATHDSAPAAEPEVLPETVLATAPPRFFAAGAPRSVPNYSSVPVSALLLEIENHVRLEQAAAESFLASPTIDLLHSRTISPLVQ